MSGLRRESVKRGSDYTYDRSVPWSCPIGDSP
jgi:hypothetical protein